MGDDVLALAREIAADEALDKRARQRAHDQRSLSGWIDVGSEDAFVATTLEYVDEKIAEYAKELGHASDRIVWLLLLPEDQAQHEADRLHVLAHELIKQIDETIDLARFIETIQLPDNIHEVRLERALERALEEAFLVLEVPEDERFADPRFLGHLRQRCTPVPLSGEQSGRRLQDLVPGVHVLAAPSLVMPLETLHEKCFKRRS